jgi:hypothetical protein
MLRIAVYYESRLGRNDGNPLYVWHELKRRQEAGELEVDHLAPMGDLKLHGDYDLHLWIDWGEDGLNGVLPYDPIYPPGNPLIYWASDTHLGYDYRLKCARQADLVYCAQERGMQEMIRDGVPARWLPHAVEPSAYPRLTLASKKYDVCFVGHVNNEGRLAFLDRMYREFPNFFFGQRFFEDAARKFCESKIVLNMTHEDDVNMRTFEALGSGSFLLTNDLPTLGRLFTDGEHLATYRTLDEAVAQAAYYLKHEDKREAIAKAGYEEVLRSHTFKHRVDTMLEDAKVMGLIGEGAVA